MKAVGLTSPLMRLGILLLVALGVLVGCSPSEPVTRASDAVMDEQNAAYKIDTGIASNFWPGTWTTTGPLTTVCMWYRATGLAPDGKVTERGYIHAGGGSVELVSGDYFSFQGCEPFRFVGRG